MTLLSGKIICITGASRGIGRACAIESARQGASGLVLHYLGDSETENEILSLKESIGNDSTSTTVAVVPGDIADAATASEVRFPM